jgi:hypothetical protein
MRLEVLLLSREPGIWSKATRILSGGVHIYIPKEVVDRALESAGMSPSICVLSRKATWLKSSRVGRARIMIELEAVGDIPLPVGVQGRGVEKVI